MADGALKMLSRDTPDSCEWALPLAQRAFSALLESARPDDSVALARARTRARRSLSALSADDRIRLDRWVSLQLATLDGIAIGEGLAVLNGVDAFLAASVRVRLPALVGELGQVFRRRCVA